MRREGGSAAAANALDLAIERGVFLVERIVGITQVLFRRHLIGAGLPVADWSFASRLGLICRSRGSGRAASGLSHCSRAGAQHNPLRRRPSLFCHLAIRLRRIQMNVAAVIDDTIALLGIGFTLPGKRICWRDVAGTHRRLAVTAWNIEYILRLT